MCRKLGMSLAATDTMTEDFSSIVQVPAPLASINTIAEFSHTYDAYGVHGSLERISIVASRVWDARANGSLADCKLDDLRTALFMTQRGWHLDGAVVQPDVGIEWELIEAINEASGGLVRDDRPILL